MAAALGAEQVRLPGAAHSPAVEAPGATAQALTAFWDAVETGTARAAEVAAPEQTSQLR